MEKGMTTGEFAKLCGLSKRTLFYYDKIDLLKPAVVDDKGYRYYNLYQADQVSTIKLFQEIGMSLKDIQAYFQLQDFSTKAQQLDSQKLAIEEKIAELQEISRGIDFLKARFLRFQEIGVNQLFEEKLSEPEYYSVEPRSTGEPLSLNFLNYGYQYGIIFEQESLQSFQEVPEASFVYRKAEKEKSNFQKPIGHYVGIFYRLKNGEMSKCVPKFLQMIASYHSIGPLFHEDYCSELACMKDEFIIKLSIRYEE